MNKQHELWAGIVAIIGGSTARAAMHEHAPTVPAGMQARPGVDYGCGAADCADCYVSLTVCPCCGGHLTHISADEGGRMSVLSVDIHPRRDRDAFYVYIPVGFNACDACEYVAQGGRA